ARRPAPPVMVMATAAPHTIDMELVHHPPGERLLFLVERLVERLQHVREFLHPLGTLGKPLAAPLETLGQRHALLRPVLHLLFCAVLRRTFGTPLLTFVTPRLALLAPALPFLGALGLRRAQLFLDGSPQ